MGLTVRRAQAAIALRQTPVTVVLMYHRVSEPAHDPFALCVSPDHFAEQLAVLRRFAEPIALSACRSASPRTRVAVTFDDGYRDNLLHALPALEVAEVPATVFIVSDAIGSGREFWWDTLERCFRGPWGAPRHLDVEAGGIRAVGEVSSDEPSLRSVHQFLLALDPEAQAAALGEIAAQLGDPVSGPTERLPLTLAELERLAVNPLVEIGAHTRRHPQLPVLPAEERADEITGSRQRLEEMLGRPVRSFSYPYGATDATTIALADAAGILQACTVAPGSVDADTHPLALPRLNVEDWDGDEFEGRLRAWLGEG